MDFMNSHTRESIGMEYILDMITPKTPYGMERKNNMQPYLRDDGPRLQDELDITEVLISLVKKHNRDFIEIDFILRNFKEIRASLERVKNEIVLDEVELFEIKNFIFNVKDMNMLQSRIPSMPEGLIPRRINELEELFDPEGTDNRTFYVYDCYSEKLKDIRTEKRRLQSLYDRERKSILKLVEDAIGLNIKLSGEIIIPRSDVDRLNKAAECPYIYEESSSILYVTFKLKKSEEMNRLMFNIEDLKYREEQEEYSVRKSLSLRIKDNIEAIYEQIKATSNLDLLLSKVEFALKINGTKPIIGDNMSFELVNGRHIKLDELLKSRGKCFTPVSCSLNNGVTIITGANMGGKTVRLKLIGMLQAMAQLGLYVPAEGFKTCIMDFIYLSIGDLQSIDSGLSTFGGEISGMIDIMHCSNHRGLILIDELARGTNPEEGYAISRAIVRYLKDKSSITLFITHFSGITQEGETCHLRVKGLKKIDFNKLKREFNEEKARLEQVQNYMDYTLERVDGEGDVPRDAINIARLMGLNEEILNWAEEILISGNCMKI